MNEADERHVGARTVDVDPKLYPFEPHWHDLDGLQMHYVDEGSADADPVLFVHGNPTWSFYWRALIQAASPTHRCIAPDHIGCGKSDKPDDAAYSYRLARRVDDLTRLVDALKLDRVTLVAHDWGGMISMIWAARHPERVRRVMLMNTAAFGLPETRGFHAPLRLTRTPLGTVLARGFNAFARGAARWGVKKPLDPKVRAGLMAPYDSWANRRALLRFVQDIPLGPADPGYLLLEEAAAGLEQFSDRPFVICWGEQDFVFDAHFLAEWERRTPWATFHRFPDAGHYVLEDEAEAITELLLELLREGKTT
jgi:haloalkane dehalogenase